MTAPRSTTAGDPYVMDCLQELAGIARERAALLADMSAAPDADTERDRQVWAWRSAAALVARLTTPGGA